MLKTMKKLVHKLTPPKGEPQPQVKNPNFRRPPIPQARLINPDEQQIIKPSFFNNFVNEEVNEETKPEQISCVDD